MTRTREIHVISRVVLAGIKSFKDQARVRFAPLTVLTGTNSSGKSTVFQSLLSIKQTFELPTVKNAGLALNGRSVMLGLYEDLSSGHRGAPSSIAVGLTRPALLGYSKKYRKYIKFWWATETSEVFLEDGDRLEAALKIELNKEDSIPTFAGLKSLMIEASASRANEVAQYRYHLSVAKESPAPEELPLEPKLDDDPPPPALYPFKVECFHSVEEKETPGQQDAGDTEDDGESPGAERNRCRAVVTGLAPASVLARGQGEAVYHTLTAALGQAVQILRIHMLPETPDGPAYKPASHVPLEGGTRSKLDRTLGFLDRCPDWAFAEFVELYETLEEDAVEAFRSEGVKKEWYIQQRPRQWLQIATRVLTRLTKLAKTHLPLPERDEESEDAGLASAIETLTTQLPAFKPLISFITTLLGYQWEPPEVERLRGMLLRAAEEVKAKRPLTQVLTYQRWRNSGRVVEPYGRAWHRAGRAAPTEDEVRTFFEDYVFHLGPLRDEPRNLYSADLPTSMADVGKRGERAIGCLRAFGSERVFAPRTDGVFDLASTTLSKAVTDWGRFLGIFTDIEVNAETKYGAVCKIETHVSGEVVRADLTNVGVGVSQLLPVLVLCLAVPVGSTVLIEQPELHLHPAVQSRLAEFFAACALTGRQVVVETHSEHLVLPGHERYSLIKLLQQRHRERKGGGSN